MDSSDARGFATTLLVLAAGRSTRFGRLKQLEPLGPGGEALLDYALYDCARLGFFRYVLVVQEDMRSRFEAHLRPAADAGLDIRFVCQGYDLPDILDEPLPHRTKPWGTGFAVLSAYAELTEPFVACNADDFYGRGALSSIARALAHPLAPGEASGSRLSAVTAGYRLDTTLSPEGGVSRGICEVAPDGTLRALTEGLELRSEGDRVRGRDPAGAPLDVSPQVPVCTSLWGFRPTILGPLADRFRAFLASDPRPAAEFYLTEAVHQLIQRDQLRCTVIPAHDQWLGVTFSEDRGAVAAALLKLAESGAYPPRLWEQHSAPVR